MKDDEYYLGFFFVGSSFVPLGFDVGIICEIGLLGKKKGTF